MENSAVLCAFLVAAACQAPPEKPFDPKDPRSVAEHVIRTTRGQKAYESTFQATLSPPKGDRIEYKGRCVWVAPGILYASYKATGGDENNIMRVGKDVWVHHAFGGWVSPEEMGKPGAGRGIQNPDDVLRVLESNLGAVKFSGADTAVITFAGEDIEKLMKDQAQKGSFDWKDSKASVVLAWDAEHRLKKFSATASLKSSDPNVPGAVDYSAEVEATGYNGATDMKFQDESKKDVPLDAPIKKAIETLMKEKK